MESYSPFQLKKYKEIMSDLFQIIEILEFIEQNLHQPTQLGKWLQLIDIYTNQYPRIALVTYLFVNGKERNDNLYHFLESLIRYIYYYGSTTRIKFEIYSINKKICSNQIIDNYYRKDIEADYFDYLGALKYGYALLAFYVDREKSISFYRTKKVINWKDKKKLNDLGWSDDDIEKNLNKLGNFFVLNANEKSIFLSIEEYSIKDLEKRDNRLRKKLVTFFRGIGDE